MYSPFTSPQLNAKKCMAQGNHSNFIKSMLMHVKVSVKTLEMLLEKGSFSGY